MRLCFDTFRLEHLQSTYGQAGLTVPKSPCVATPSRIARALARMLVPKLSSVPEILVFSGIERCAVLVC